MKKEGEKEEKQIRSAYVFQLITQSAYKRIAILIKARTILPCEVIAAISPNAFSASIINASLLGDSGEDETNKRLESAKESVSRETSAEIDRDSINGTTERLFVFVFVTKMSEKIASCLFAKIFSALNALNNQND